jgi:hypothetical protein
MNGATVRILIADDDEVDRKLESAVGQGSSFSFTWPKDNGSTNKPKYKFKRIGETL